MGRRTWAVVVAAGRGLRMGGDVPKQYLVLDPGRVVNATADSASVDATAGERPDCECPDFEGPRPAMLFEQAMAPFLSHPEIAGLVLVAPEADCEWLQRRLQRRWLRAPWLLAQCAQRGLPGWSVVRTFDPKQIARPVVVVPGGAERIDSVRAGLQAASALNAAALAASAVCPAVDAADGHAACRAPVHATEHTTDESWVLVHDGARPCLSEADLTALTTWSPPHPPAGQGPDPSGVVLAAESVDSLKEVDAAGRVVAAPDRRRVWRALTPQGFPLAPLLDAVTEATQADAATRAGWTDEASVWAARGWPVYVLRGQADNIKVTRPEDARRAMDWLIRHHPERCLA